MKYYSLNEKLVAQYYSCLKDEGLFLNNCDYELFVPSDVKEDLSNVCVVERPKYSNKNGSSRVSLTFNYSYFWTVKELRKRKQCFDILNEINDVEIPCPKPKYDELDILPIT